MKMKSAATLLCVAILGITGADCLEAQARRGGEGTAVGPRSGWQRQGVRPMRDARMQGARRNRAERGMPDRGMAGRGMQDRGMAGPMALDLRIGQWLDRRHTLDLTDRQVEELGALRDEIRRETEPLRAEMQAMRDARRDGTLDRDSLRARMRDVAARRRTIQEAFHGRLEGVLEPRQRALVRAAGRRTPRR